MATPRTDNLATPKHIHSVVEPRLSIIETIIVSCVRASSTVSEELVFTHEASPSQQPCAIDKLKVMHAELLCRRVVAGDGVCFCTYIGISDIYSRAACPRCLTLTKQHNIGFTQMCVCECAPHTHAAPHNRENAKPKSKHDDVAHTQHSTFS